MMKTIRMTCHGCNQNFESQTEMDGRSSACPNCYNELPVQRPTTVAGSVLTKLGIVIAGALLTGLVAAYLGMAKFHQENDEDPLTQEGPLEKRTRLKQEAEKSMRECAERDAVGFTRIIHAYVFGEGDDTEKWTGSVDLENVNLQGGVEHTNKLYKFGILESHIYALEDYEAEFTRRKPYNR